MKTYISAIKAALIIGTISAIVNSIWGYVIIQSFNITGLPEGFTVAIVIASIIPTLIA